MAAWRTPAGRPDRRMLFNSYEFLLAFAPVVVALFHLARARSPETAKVVLLLASLVFYGYWNVDFLPLLLGSIGVNYGLSLAIARSRSALLLAGAVAGNLALLFYFKYLGFFADIAGIASGHTGIDFLIGGLVLPLGISFFTFQQIAYQVDRWRAGAADGRSLLDYAVFVSFFPQLIAGPIVRDNEFLPQLRAGRRPFDAALFTVGLLVFSLGLFKKVVVADGFALIASPLFGAAADGVALSLDQAWLAALGYSFQLYFDFSAYSDMAFGLGALFGIVLPINFLAPYRATSPIEFWRRWHITLGRFLRDYLYFPLGGSRRGRGRHLANLVLVMLLCGLWHGAGWTFVIWGGLHGLALAAQHLARRLGLASIAAGPAGLAVSWAATFLFVVAGWVMFRAATPEAAVAIWGSMLGFAAGAESPVVELAIAAPAAWALVATALAWVLLLPTPYRWFFGTTAADPHADAGALRLDGRTAGLCGLLLAAGFLALSAPSEFLYYDF